MAKTDRSLNSDERGEVENCVASALERFGDGAAGESPDQLQERLYQEINSLRSDPDGLPKADLSQTALCLGCLWGQTVCDRLGWEWAAVSLEPGSEFYGIVSPSRSHVVFPLHYLQDLLSDPDRDQTSLLVYNMLKAGNLPPSAPGEYTVLG
jgi:hypothetical protein